MTARPVAAHLRRHAQKLVDQGDPVDGAQQLVPQVGGQQIGASSACRSRNQKSCGSSPGTGRVAISATSRAVPAWAGAWASGQAAHHRLLFGPPPFGPPPFGAEGRRRYVLHALASTGQSWVLLLYQAFQSTP